MGIIVHERLLPHVKVFESINDRIYYILLKGKFFDIAVISCYSPTEEKKDEKKANFMKNWKKFITGYLGIVLKYFLGILTLKLFRRLCIDQQ